MYGINACICNRFCYLTNKQTNAKKTTAANYWLDRLFTQSTTRLHLAVARRDTTSLARLVPAKGKGALFVCLFVVFVCLWWVFVCLWWVFVCLFVCLFVCCCCLFVCLFVVVVCLLVVWLVMLLIIYRRAHAAATARRRRPHATPFGAQSNIYCCHYLLHIDDVVVDGDDAICSQLNMVDNRPRHTTLALIQ
jgi:hypothetical protein